MSEKPPAFTVTDRRKFNLDGEPREESSPEIHQPTSTPIETAPESSQRQAPTQALQEETGPVVVATPETEEEAVPELAELTAEETSEQHAAYQQSSLQLDDMLRQANPGMAPETGVVAFEHVVQSIYLSAMMAMGAGTEQGQKPRIDILGARQSIDMLAVLQEKTKGNLNEKERLLLQNALFELRMMFLEITNAIAQQAIRKPGDKK
jgi:hypothetical protein